MLSWMPWRGMGAGVLAILTVVALALSLSLIESFYGRVDGGPAAAGQVGLQPDATGRLGTIQSSSEATHSLDPSATQESSVSWSTAFTIPPGPYSRLGGIAEAGDTLFALGRSDRSQPAIWVSRDGSTWTAAELPGVTERLDGVGGPSAELTAIVLDVEDTGDRLVALATVGLADGSGPIGTMIYVSDDTGVTWSRVRGTPSSIDGAMFELARRGDRLIAAGTAIWASDDGGLSWSEIVDAQSLGGTLHSVDVRGDLIVAAGEGGNGDVTSPPALVLVSTDGHSWERTVLDPEGVARSVAIGEGGRIIVAGHLNAELRIWVSNDAGKTWEIRRPSVGCCVDDLVSTPDGYIATSSGPFDGVLASTDGLTWNAIALDGGPEVVGWGPAFGLVGARDDAILVERMASP